MKISTCLSTNPAKFDAVPFKGELEKNCIDIAGMGFDGIELAVRDPDIIDQDKTIEVIRASGMEIPALGTGQAWGEEGLSFTDPDPETRARAVKRIFSHIKFASKSGSLVVIGLLRGVVQAGVSEKNAWEWMYESFSRCCDRAESAGIKIAFEPINRYETTLLNGVEEGLEFIRRVGGDSLGMLLDTFHMNIEEPVVEKSIVSAGNKIFHFHYSDSNRWYPGAGHIDFKSIMTALKDVGYHGYLSGEHRPDPEPRTAVRKGLQYMRELTSLLGM